jgi:tetratricopeptide (TPR) repeat protein
MAMGLAERALPLCREELERAPRSIELMRLNALAEGEAGNLRRAIELWQQLIEREGWQHAYAHGWAAALWRMDAMDEAEAVLRDNIERTTTPLAHQSLIRLLLSLERWDDALEAAEQASEAYPDECGFVEAQGVAEAEMGHHERASELLAAAMDKGCTAERWANYEVFAPHLYRSTYRRLLNADDLTRDLSQLDDFECRQRMRLLRSVMRPEVAPLITREILARSDIDVRLAGLALLYELGPGAVDAWQRLLVEGDADLRALTLRPLRAVHDAAFVPLLEAHRQREESPELKALTSLALGESLVAAGDPVRARSVLETVPVSTAAYSQARLALATLAEQRGDPAAALELIEQATAADPELRIDPRRLADLEAAVTATQGD